MPDGGTSTVRAAADEDLADLIRLRAAWTSEYAARKGLPAPDEADPAYVEAFRTWWARERDQRVTWLAEVVSEVQGGAVGEADGRAVGMLNMLVFSRMPRPGRAVSQWGYVANVFVLEPHRGGGIGAKLLDEALAYAEQHDFARLVLSPSERSVPFYDRAGFGPATSLMVRE